MIYFLDNSLQLQKIVTSKNVISAIHEHELNGLIRADVELDLSYVNKFLVLGIDHVGYYYKDEFYLHKIQRVEYDHVNETATVVLRHIFFEDMIFGKLIRDVRPQNQDALTVSRQTIDANTRWQTIMTDVTGRLSTNFYWQVPYEVIEFMTENYRIEYLPKILFDGKKINGFQLHLANKIGEDKNIRIPYGSRVLDLKYEEDYSEIITKLVVHGKGEEVGDGYGRRINISDVNFSRNGVKSPIGSLYLEDESITNTYGNDGQTPREGREVFEDIEDANELAEAGYQHYLQVSRPQMLFTADVADIGDVGIGDSVMIIRREYDVYFKARIHKLSVDLLYPEDAQVELGDYEHFKESKIARKTREKNNRVQGQLSDRITRLKQEADERFDNEVEQWKSEYEQALINVRAQIEADRENMTNLIEGTRTEFTDNLNTEITQTKEYAEQQAQEKAETVRTDLETVTSGHQALIDGLKDNVMSIDEFIGDKTTPLNKILLDERVLIEDKINSISTWHYNLLRGSRFDEQSMYSLSLSRGEIITTESVPFFRNNLSSAVPYIGLLEEFPLDSDREYTFSIDYRTNSVIALNYVTFISRDGTSNVSLHSLSREGNHDELVMDGGWRRAYFRFTPPRDLFGTLRIGVNFNTMDRPPSQIDLRLPYLTETGRTQWLYHQLDNTQSMEEVTRRITELEDGREEFITRTQYNFETGEIEGTIRNILETVDGRESIIQNHENWILTNGASVIESAEGFQSKAWLSDIHNPNMLSFANVTNGNHYEFWESLRADAHWVLNNEWIRVRATESVARTYLGTYSPTFEVIRGETYTVSFEAFAHAGDNADDRINYSFVTNNDFMSVGLSTFMTRKPISSVAGTTTYLHTATFTAPSTTNKARLLIGTRVETNGTTATFYFKHPKVEVGNRATPYRNAFSNLTQRADEMMLAVQGIDTSGFLSQSDIIIRPEYAQIGSQRLDGSNIGSLLRVSPTGIDMVAEALRLSGDLYVDGDITALAVDAIEGNFARLFANQLTANVITSDHIQVGTALVDKMFATSARIDQLITKTHFVNEMHALTLNVVDLNASHIRSRLLTANTIEASWIKSGTALLDRVFSSTAMFERMMAKSAFVTTLSTITLDLHELTIWRPDGVAVIQNGMQRFGLPVTFVQQVSGGGTGDVSVQTNYWETNARGAQQVGGIYTEHAGRWLNVGVGVGLRADADHASTKMGVVIRPSNIPSGASWPSAHIEEFTVYRGSTDYYNINVPLGRPTFGAASWTLEFYRIGDNNRNPVQLRRRRIWISA